MPTPAPACPYMVKTQTLQLTFVFPNTVSSPLSSSTSVLGVDSISHYTEVIRQVRYQSRQAVDSVRTFRLTCSELNGRYTSDQYTLQVRTKQRNAVSHGSDLCPKDALYHSFSKVNILHSEDAIEHVNHVMAPPKYMQIIHPTVIESNSYSLGE